MSPALLRLPSLAAIAFVNPSLHRSRSFRTPVPDREGIRKNNFMAEYLARPRRLISQLSQKWRKTFRVLRRIGSTIKQSDNHRRPISRISEYNFGPNFRRLRIVRRQHPVGRVDPSTRSYRCKTAAREVRAGESPGNRCRAARRVRSQACISIGKPVQQSIYNYNTFRREIDGRSSDWVWIQKPGLAERGTSDINSGQVLGCTDRPRDTIREPGFRSVRCISRCGFDALRGCWL